MDIKKNNGDFVSHSLVGSFLISCVYLLGGNLKKFKTGFKLGWENTLLSEHDTLNKPDAAWITSDKLRVI